MKFLVGITRQQTFEPPVARAGVTPTVSHICTREDLRVTITINSYTIGIPIEHWAEIRDAVEALIASERAKAEDGDDR